MYVPTFITFHFTPHRGGVNIGTFRAARSCAVGGEVLALANSPFAARFNSRSRKPRRGGSRRSIILFILRPDPAGVCGAANLQAHRLGGTNRRARDRIHPDLPSSAMIASAISTTVLREL